MGKKRKKKRDREARKQQEVEKTPNNDESAVGDEKEAISSAGRKTIVGGVALLIAGFIILTFTDPQGRNWASTLSPLLILGAYGVIAYGIFLPGKEPSSVPDEKETKKEAPESS
ncbi:MAG: hypothetical protein ABIJ96_04480 [Elusimicrobiota bacterium]